MGPDGLARVGDICCIMKLAAKLNVAEMRIGGLHVVFQRLSSYGQLEKPQSESIHSDSSVSSSPQRGAVANESQLLEDARMTQMLVDDPEAFEQEMIDGYLQNRRVTGEEAEDR